MPTQSDKLTDLRDSADKGTIPYISKSRLLKYVTCPESFRWGYIKGIKQPETTAMARGTTIHEVFEDFYENAAEYVEEHGDFPDDLTVLLPAADRWADYTEPYISNFLVFEHERWEAVGEHGAPSEEAALNLWLPVAVEAEGWLEDPLPEWEGDQPPWMGYADVIYHTASVPGAEGTGVTIIDHKTGKTPKEQYREEGIYLQGTYYRILFEELGYTVDAVGGYYPKGGDLILSPRSVDRAAFVYETIREMLEMDTETSPWPIDEQPLCKWGEGSENQCTYYDLCSSRWGEGLKHPEKFTDLVESGATFDRIADEMDMSKDAIGYTKYKLGL